MQAVVSVRLDLVDQNGIEDVRTEVEATLSRLAPVVVEMVRDRHAAISRELVSVFLQGATPRAVDLAQARLQARAFRQVFEGTEWLSAAQIGELAQLGTGNPTGSVNRWKSQRKLFAIHRDGKDHYPRYGLGPDFRPLPQLADVLQVLAHYDGERLAAWFESPSGYLGGQRPRELLASQPEQVLAAARDAVEAEQVAG
jgi:hypothetical protein